MFQQFFKKFFYQTFNFHPAFSNTPQNYNLTHSVSLSALQNLAGELILPIPSTVTGQTVVNENKHTFHLDPYYGNKFEVIRVELLKGQTFNIKRHYKIKRSTIELSAGQFCLDDYKTSGKLDRKFLKPNRLINPHLPQVKQAAADILIKSDSLHSALSEINRYVIQTLNYGNPITGLYSVTEALRLKTVDCGGYDTLFASICLALGIPARLVAGYWLGYKQNLMHAWLELQLPNGQWLPADPSVEALRKVGRSKKIGGLGKIGSDRIAFSYGCDIKLFEYKNVVVDILQVPFILPETEQRKVKISNNLISEIVSNI